MGNNRKLWWSRRKTDFRFDWFNGTGGGGQYRNKNANCLRLTDIQTGIVTISQEHRSRMQNQRAAFKRMVNKLKEYYTQLDEKDKIVARSSDINKTTRTYHECDDRVTDHVTGRQYSFKHTVGKGNINQIIDDRRKK